MTDFEPVTVTLARPVKYGTDNKLTCTEITFAQPVLGKDLVAMDAVQGEQRRNYAMLASMAGVPLQVFLGMTLRDIGKVSAAAASRLGEFSQAEDEPAE